MYSLQKRVFFYLNFLSLRFSGFNDIQLVVIAYIHKFSILFLPLHKIWPHYPVQHQLQILGRVNLNKV